MGASFGGEALSRASPPAGPPKLDYHQFSKKESNLSTNFWLHDPDEFLAEKNENLEFWGQHADLEAIFCPTQTYSNQRSVFP